MIFVFGSNDAGIHGGGAALFAKNKYGAVEGEGEGHYGNSYAIPTKYVSNYGNLVTLSYAKIQLYVDSFVGYAILHPELSFQVTQVGCGLAGLKAWKMAAMFKQAPTNCYFDEAWKAYLGPAFQYWGTFKG